MVFEAGGVNWRCMLEVLWLLLLELLLFLLLLLLLLLTNGS